MIYILGIGYDFLEEVEHTWRIKEKCDFMQSKYLVKKQSMLSYL